MRTFEIVPLVRAQRVRKPPTCWTNWRCKFVWPLDFTCITQCTILLPRHPCGRPKLRYLFVHNAFTRPQTCWGNWDVDAFAYWALLTTPKAKPKAQWFCTATNADFRNGATCSCTALLEIPKRAAAIGMQMRLNIELCIQCSMPSPLHNDSATPPMRTPEIALRFCAGRFRKPQRVEAIEM